MSTRDETKKSLWPQHISYGSFYFYHCYLLKHIKLYFLTLNVRGTKFGMQKCHVYSQKIIQSVIRIGSSNNPSITI